MTSSSSVNTAAGRAQLAPDDVLVLGELIPTDGSSQRATGEFAALRRSFGALQLFVTFELARLRLEPLEALTRGAAQAKLRHGSASELQQARPRERERIALLKRSQAHLTGTGLAGGCLVRRRVGYPLNRAARLATCRPVRPENRPTCRPVHLTCLHRVLCRNRVASTSLSLSVVR